MNADIPILGGRDGPKAKRRAAFGCVTAEKTQKEETAVEGENKTRTAVWLKPSTIRKIDEWMAAANCETRSEFIEKALVFYTGYLETNDASKYLCEVLSNMIKGILDNNNNRLRSLLFKWAVELNMACHTVAAHFKVDEIDRRELRAYAIDEVKKTNGQVSFDHALDIQRQL